jgi:hypothetical protein
MTSDSPGMHQYSLNLAEGRSTAASVDFLVRLKPAIPTVVYDTYWKFAAERQAVFFARINGVSPPWTVDPILQRFKFTNAYRASDRTSQYLIQNVIYKGPQLTEEVFFRTLLFKLFNRIRTWELLEERLGQITWEDYSFSDYDRVLSGAFNRGEKLYSAAYIIPSPQVFGYGRKHQNHLRLLEKMMRAEVPQRLQQCRRMQDAYDLLRSFPSLGDFLAFQFVTDLNYSNVTCFSEMEFVVPGPGALNGIRKCFADLGGLNEVDIIKFMADRQQEEFSRLGLAFRDLWGRALQLVDCQNLFCEVDKYARVAHPEILGRSTRTRIKQTFQASAKALKYWYPPKWGLNRRIREDVGE